MRRSWLVALVGVGLTAVASPAAASPAAAPPAGPDVAIFYYPWWGTPARDRAWLHWGQNGSQPPASIASAYYPARGVYSSADPVVVRSQMREIAGLGVRTVIVSWWGPGSAEDARLPLVVQEARAARLRVAVHVEPWSGRTPATAADAIRALRATGIADFFVYDSPRDADDAWASALADLGNVRVFANTPLPGKAKTGGFDGLYTYDVNVYDGDSFARTCSSARRLGLLCAPSVGPGYDARRATGDTQVSPRLDGRRYDTMWRRALRARADAVTITSYNEWHEGTQIEAARTAGSSYSSYEGAYGLTGRAAEQAYLTRTAYWIARLRGRR